MDQRTEARFADWAGARVAGFHRLAYMLCGDWQIAEDLVQEALARAALRWSRIESTDHPEAYVRKIIVNNNRAHWRTKAARPKTVGMAGTDLSVGDATNEYDTRDELLLALRGLPSRQRAVLVLRYFEQLSEAETASVMGAQSAQSKANAARRWHHCADR